MDSTRSSAAAPTLRPSHALSLSLVLIAVALGVPTSPAARRVDDSAIAEPRQALVVAALPSEPPVAPPARARLPLLEGPTVKAPRHTWRSLFGTSWQIVSRELEPPEVTDAREGTRGACAAGMVHVRGRMKTGGDIDELQLTTCTDWMNHQYPARCAAYDRDRWLDLSAPLPTQTMDYCIDRFEYPNLAGQYPVAYVSYVQATGLCEQQGKRLCSEDEWTFACEGEEARPYGYGDGFTRDASTCVADCPYRDFDPATMSAPTSRRAALAMDDNWQGVASGSQPGCVSSFGVHDMNANVDEWTTSTRADGRRSILKGGYWGRVRARCRPSTRSHWEHHAYYQQGFRCCAATPSG